MPTQGTDKGAVWELCRDIMAFSNTRDGGAIVIGVDFPPVDPVGLSNDQAQSWDQTPIYQALRDHATPAPVFYLKHVQHEGRAFVIIEIPEFQNIPTICSTDGHSSSGKQILRRSAVYIRTEGGQTIEIDEAEQMRDLVDRAVSKGRQRLAADVANVRAQFEGASDADDRINRDWAAFDDL